MDRTTTRPRKLAALALLLVSLAAVVYLLTLPGFAPTVAACMMTGSALGAVEWLRELNRR